MAFMKLLFFTFFCVFLLCVGRISQSDVEERMAQWFNDLKNIYYDQCIHFLSEESLQELDDNVRADNGEIRTWKWCVSDHRGYIKGVKINLEKIFEDTKKYFPEITPTVMRVAESYARMCKIEAERSDVAIDVLGIFINCAFERC